jgi:hypothetical protein
MKPNELPKTTFNQAPIIKKHYGSKTSIKAEFKDPPVNKTTFETAIPQKKQQNSLLL